MNKIQLLFSLFLTCNLGHSQDFKSNSKAIKYIKCSKEFEKLNLKNKNIFISEDILNYNMLNSFFSKNTAENSSEEIVKVDSELIKLNKNKKTGGTIFFTQVVDNKFIVELIPSQTLKKYSLRPHFGYSILFLFKLKNDSLYLVDSIRLDYN